MSKIGRKPISFAAVQISLDGNNVTIKGSKAEFNHELPAGIVASVKDKTLKLAISEDTRKNRMLWGLHRALLANKIQGAESGFEKEIRIVGLGYKVQKSGDKLVFSLGFSHKCDYTLPKGVTIDIDKKGQILKLRSADKFLLGTACDAIRSLKRPEPYKGTGIIRDGDVLIRKAGKTKGA